MSEFESKSLRGKEKNLLSGMFFRKIDYVKEEQNLSTL
jgi:hypothetical protein